MIDIQSNESSAVQYIVTDRLSSTLRVRAYVGWFGAIEANGKQV